MIKKNKLIEQVSKAAKISIDKATTAYETILKESPSWRKTSAKTATAKVEKAVAVKGDTKIKEVKMVKEKAVKAIVSKEKIKEVKLKKEKIVKIAAKPKIKEVKLKRDKAVIKKEQVTKIKPVEIIKEVPIEVVKVVELVKEVPVEIEKIVEVIKEVEIEKEVPVYIDKEIIKEVEVIKEVPVEVIKEIEVIKEVEVIREVPVEVIKEVIKEVKVEKQIPVESLKEITLIKEVIDEKEINKWKEKCDNLKGDYSGLKEDLANWKKKYQALENTNAKLTKDLSAKPKEIIKEVEVVKEIEVIKEIQVEVIKEVQVEVIREVEVVKEMDFSMLEEMMAGLETVEISKQVVGESRTEGEATVVDRREVTESTRTKVSGKSISSGKGKKDDLTKIEGIGPKIAEILNNHGIHTFRELADSKSNTIKEWLVEAGPRFKMHNPGSWPKQSHLAANGKWKALQKLQDELDGGK